MMLCRENVMYKKDLAFTLRGIPTMPPAPPPPHPCSSCFLLIILDQVRWLMVFFLGRGDQVAHGLGGGVGQVAPS